MSKNLLIIIVAIIVIAGGGALVASMSKDNNDDPANSNSTSQTTSPTSRDTRDDTASQSTPAPQPASNDVMNENEEENAAATITFSASGFSPTTQTVLSGDSVQIKNTSDDDLQFYSDPHPDHTSNEELNIGLIDPGETKTFTVSKKGTYGYHNHLDSSQKGTLTVQ